MNNKYYDRYSDRIGTEVATLIVIEIIQRSFLSQRVTILSNELLHYL